MSTVRDRNPSMVAFLQRLVRAGATPEEIIDHAMDTISNPILLGQLAVLAREEYEAFKS